MLAGKYAIIDRWFGGSVLFNMETKEEYENLNKYKDVRYAFGDNFFFTSKAFYYVKEYVLYKYISEDESEIVYDGSRYSSNFDVVSEDYLIVSDEMGTFLVDRATGEETKLELETE